MGSSGGSKVTSDTERSSGAHRRRGGIEVEHEGVKRPFMRGMVIHSLMARGISFDDAYAAAEAVRKRFSHHGVVQKSDIAKALREIIGEESFQEDRTVPLPPDIRVTGHGKGTPFSKGHLSQSLLAAALDPNDAFDVAREIERGLVVRGVREISRHDLRRITFEALNRRKSTQAAERYLVWRRYQNPDRPVIILLGGAAGVGKTSLALEVAHRLGIGRVLSTDSIRQIMRIILSKALLPTLHASSYDAYKLLPPDAVGDDPVIEGFLSQAATVSVGVRASMDRAIAENASLVMDGVSLVPGLLDLDSYSELADVIFLSVAALDEDSFENRFAARASEARSRAPHRYLENLDAILRIQNHLLELSDRYDVPIVDNVSFDRSVSQIIRYVTETLRKRGDFDVAALL